MGGDRAVHTYIQAQAVRAGVKGGVQLRSKVILGNKMRIHRGGFIGVGA